MAPKSPTKTGGKVIVFIHQIIYLPKADNSGNHIAPAKETADSNTVNNWQNRLVIGVFKWWIFGDRIYHLKPESCDDASFV